VRRLHGYRSLVVIVVVAIGALVYTFAVGNKPLLGLDLQGGVSVVLQPTGDVESDTLDEAITIIRQRVDALGVAEPEITRQGDNILIQIPGVKDKDRALALVGQTAELQFRPVLASNDPSVLEQGAPDTTPGNEPPAADPGSSTTTGAGEQGLGSVNGESAAGVAPVPRPLGDAETAQAETTTTTTPEGTTDTTAPATDTTATANTLSPDVCTTGVPASDTNPTGTVQLPQCEEGQLVAVYTVGPVALTGSALDTARATLLPSGEWVVNPVFKGGSDGIGLFNAAAAQCNPPSTTCPTGQLAIVLDGRVISAPVIQTSSFQADQIQVTGSFTEGDAKDLATSLKYGALPVELEQQQAQIVSATLGRDALDAGLTAGIVGMVLVALYMIAFYRLLGLLAILKLAIEGALLWSMISYLGTSNGLALTLAGITGIIVSIGVSVDSNVVYYEHLKEDVHNGRTVRSATDRAFHASFSTIVKADVASLIAAGLLWWLTVGPVRGFAFYLGLSTLLDLVASWMYMRPAVKLATRSPRLRAMPRLLGLPAEAPEPPERRGRGGAPARPTTGASR
jgi:preprotein translocase subunit SecD